MVEQWTILTVVIQSIYHPVNHTSEVEEEWHELGDYDFSFVGFPVAFKETVNEVRLKDSLVASVIENPDETQEIFF